MLPVVKQTALLATVLHLHRGTPCIYQGEELGMTNAAFTSIDDFRDIESLRHHAHAVANGEDPERVLDGLRAMSRDNARTPMQWDASPHAGFTTGEPWIPVHPNHLEINAEQATADSASVYHYYRRLIALRHTEPVAVHGDFTPLLPDDERVYAFTRRCEDTEILVLGNFTGEPAPVRLPADWEGADLVITNLQDAVPLHATLTLAPWEARVHRRDV